MGKEGNKVEEVATDEVTDPDEVLIDYGDDAWERLVLPVGRVMGICTMALETGLARAPCSSTCSKVGRRRRQRRVHS